MPGGGLTLKASGQRRGPDTRFVFNYEKLIHKIPTIVWRDYKIHDSDVWRHASTF